MRNTAFLLLGTILVVGTECFTASPRHEQHAISKSSLFVLADPPHQDVSDHYSSGAGAPNLQPIRRLRRDKKEPLIAIVGRPNVVS